MTHVTCRLTAKNRDQLRNPIRSAIEYVLPLPFLLTDLDSIIAISGGVVKAWWVRHECVDQGCEPDYMTCNTTGLCAKRCDGNIECGDDDPEDEINCSQWPLSLTLSLFLLIYFAHNKRAVIFQCTKQAGTARLRSRGGTGVRQLPVPAGFFFKIWPDSGNLSQFLGLSTISHAVKRKLGICLPAVYDARHCDVTCDR